MNLNMRIGVILSFMSSLAVITHANAYTLFDNPSTTLNLDVNGVMGAFHSQKGYSQIASADSARDWQEGYINYGLGLNHLFGRNKSSLYEKLSWTTSTTLGQGDAAHFTNGHEHDTGLEQAYIGWKSGSLIPFLGEDGIDVSAGRQSIQVGDGFLIAGDSLNFGKGALNGSLNRGGAYYLAARKAFANTAVVRLGGSTGWRGDLMWLKSNNAAQAKPQMFVGTLEHVADQGTLGFDYINVFNDSKHYGSELYPDRDHTKVYSVRGQGNAGVKQLFLSAQYAYEDTGASTHKKQSAWYIESGWTFSQLPWTPYISYRFSRFSSGYDPLFYGDTRALGTWFQGEVASNYAGPFNSNARIQQLGLTVTPNEALTLGLLGYRFNTVNKRSGPNLDATEWDLYANWGINKHWWVMPLIGRYSPRKSLSEGGSQLGSSHANIYTQLLVGFNF